MDRLGQNALHYTVEYGTCDMLQYLLEQFPEFDVNQRNLSWCTPLHIAVKRENYELVKFLLQKGADIQATTVEKQTALHFAAHSGSVEITKLLLGKGAKVDVYDDEDQSPLSLAVLTNNKEVLQILIMKGAR